MLGFQTCSTALAVRAFGALSLLFLGHVLTFALAQVLSHYWCFIAAVLVTQGIEPRILYKCSYILRQGLLQLSPCPLFHSQASLLCSYHCFLSHWTPPAVPDDLLHFWCLSYVGGSPWARAGTVEVMHSVCMSHLGFAVLLSWQLIPSQLQSTHTRGLFWAKTPKQLLMICATAWVDLKTLRRPRDQVQRMSHCLSPPNSALV